eukprot:2721162-Prorocentrum_lima.AAC.1
MTDAPPPSGICDPETSADRNLYYWERVPPSTMAYFSDMFPRHLVRLLRRGTDYTLDQSYFDACRHPMTGELIPYFHGVFFQWPCSF